MGNYLIIVFILLLIVMALSRAKKHFRGGCCSSGNTIIRESKVLTEPIIGEYTLVVQGMHCQNCAARIENALNRLDGVLCNVHLKKKIAVVSFSREVSADILKSTIEQLGYQVTQVR